MSLLATQKQKQFFAGILLVSLFVVAAWAWPKFETQSERSTARMIELLQTSEGLRQIEKDWERIWFTDQPSHLTYERVSFEDQGSKE